MKKFSCIVSILAPLLVVANEVTWSGGGGTGDRRWSSGANWVGGTPPGSGDIAVIPSNTTAWASHHTDANGGDMTTINALGGLRIEGDGRVEIDYEQDGNSSTCCFSWNVPIYGIGTFVVMNGVNNDRYLRMNVDNSGFNGSFLVSNALMRVKHVNGLGVRPVTLSCSANNHGLLWETSGVYSNDIVGISPSSSAPRFGAPGASIAVTNLGSATLLSGRLAPSYITVLGGIYNPSNNLQGIMCKEMVRIGGAGSTGNIQISSGTLHVAAPMYPAEGKNEYEILNNGANVSLVMEGQYLSTDCVLNVGTTHNFGTKVDLNGCDQSIKTLKFGTDYTNVYTTDVPNQEITSEKPAKLTIKGTQTSNGAFFYGVLTGRASLELSSEMWTGLWVPIGSVGNTTRGSIFVRGGKLRLMPRCVFTNLSSLDIYSDSKSAPAHALLETGNVNPGKVEVVLGGAYATLQIEDGVQLDAKFFKLDDEFMPAGVYGSADAHEAYPDLVDENHVIGRMQGLGTMRVRLSGPPGAVLIFR